MRNKLIENIFEEKLPNWQELEEVKEYIENLEEAEEEHRKEVEQCLKELTEVRPEKLNDKALRLFKVIMQILDERDELKEEIANLKAIEAEHRKINGELRKKIEMLEETSDLRTKTI